MPKRTKYLWIPILIFIVSVIALMMIWWFSTPKESRLNQQLLLLIVDKLLIASLIGAFAFIGQRLIEKYKTTQGIRGEFAKKRLEEISKIANTFADIQNEILNLNVAFMDILNENLDKVYKQEDENIFRHRKEMLEAMENKDHASFNKLINSEDYNYKDNLWDIGFQKAVEIAKNKIVPETEELGIKLESMEQDIDKSYFWIGDILTEKLKKLLIRLKRLYKVNSDMFKGKVPESIIISELASQVNSDRINIEELYDYL